MRTAFWLTAATLTALALTTVAVAEYLHPSSFIAYLMQPSVEQPEEPDAKPAANPQSFVRVVDLNFVEQPPASQPSGACPECSRCSAKKATQPPCELGFDCDQFLVNLASLEVEAAIERCKSSECGCKDKCECCKNSQDSIVLQIEGAAPPMGFGSTTYLLCENDLPIEICNNHDQAKIFWRWNEMGFWSASPTKIRVVRMENGREACGEFRTEQIGHVAVHSNMRLVSEPPGACVKIVHDKGVVDTAVKQAAQQCVDCCKDCCPATVDKAVKQAGQKCPDCCKDCPGVVPAKLEPNAVCPKVPCNEPPGDDEFSGTKAPTETPGAVSKDSSFTVCPYTGCYYPSVTSSTDCQAGKVHYSKGTEPCAGTCEKTCAQSTCVIGLTPDGKVTCDLDIEVELVGMPACKAVSDDDTEKALDQLVSFECNSKGLRDVLYALCSTAGANLVIDRPALTCGIDFETPVTALLNRVTLRTALKLVLRDTMLTYVVEDGVIVVQSASTMAVRSYPVGDLVKTFGECEGDDEQQYSERLVKLIRDTVNPSTWARADGSCHVEYYPLTESLVVSQSPETHEQIAVLLDRLRELRDMHVRGEVVEASYEEMVPACNSENCSVSFPFELEDGTKVTVCTKQPASSCFSRLLHMIKEHCRTTDREENMDVEFPEILPPPCVKSDCQKSHLVVHVGNGGVMELSGERIVARGDELCVSGCATVKHGGWFLAGDRIVVRGKQVSVSGCRTMNIITDFFGNVVLVPDETAPANKYCEGEDFEFKIIPALYRELLPEPPTCVGPHQLPPAPFQSHIQLQSLPPLPISGGCYYYGNMPKRAGKAIPETPEFELFGDNWFMEFFPLLWPTNLNQLEEAEILWRPAEFVPAGPFIPVD